MAIFNSYVKLPEGMCYCTWCIWVQVFRWPGLSLPKSSMAHAWPQPGQQVPSMPWSQVRWVGPQGSSGGGSNLKYRETAMCPIMLGVEACKFWLYNRFLQQCSRLQELFFECFWDWASWDWDELENLLHPRLPHDTYALKSGLKVYKVQSQLCPQRSWWFHLPEATPR